MRTPISYVLIASVFSNFILYGHCANILCVFQMPAVSHHATFQPIWRELSLRGHQVTVVTPYPLKDTSLANLTEIDTSYTHEIITRHGFEFFMSKELSVHSKIIKIFHMYYEFAEAIFNNQEFRKIYTNPEAHKFDVILAQIYINPIMFALSEKFKAPVIGVSSMGGWQGTHYAAGNPNPPSLYSEMFLPYNGRMTFSERFRSTLYYLWSRFYVYFIAMPKCDQIARKYLGQDLPYLADIEKNVSALLLNTNPALYAQRSNIPTIVSLGFMHIKSLKPLSNDLKKVLDDAKNGVVYFSLGSNVKSKNIPQTIRNLLMETFAELPYKVLWKFENDELPGKPDNVVINKWLPQQDVLGHPNVKVFLTQCGLQSTEEAIYRTVPIVGIPFIADQEMNMKKLAEWEVGIFIDYLTVTKEELKMAIIEVAENQLYKENMVKLRDLLLDQPTTSLEKAMWWIEYVIRHKGTKLYRSPTADVSWFEYLLVDVILVMSATLLTILLILHKMGKAVLGLCYRSSAANKKHAKKKKQ